MITKVNIKVFIVLSVLSIGLSYCTSLSKVELSENPDFFANAEEYSLAHSFPQVLTFDLNYLQERSQLFEVTNLQTKRGFQVKVKYFNTTSEAELVRKLSQNQDEEVVEEVLKNFFTKMDSISEQRENDTIIIAGFNKAYYFYQGMSFYNPLNDLNYCILSKVFYYRDRLQIDPPTLIDKSYLFFPIEYWIFEEDAETGYISFYKSYAQISDLGYALEANILINSRRLHSKFQGFSYKRKTSIECEDQLLAFFELKPPKAGVANDTYKELIGKVLVKAESSNEEKAEIFTTYIIFDLAYNYLQEDILNNIEWE